MKARRKSKKANRRKWLKRAAIGAGSLGLAAGGVALGRRYGMQFNPKGLLAARGIATAGRSAAQGKILAVKDVVKRPGRNLIGRVMRRYR